MNFDNDGCNNGPSTITLANPFHGINGDLQAAQIRLVESNGPSGAVDGTDQSNWKDNPHT
ncbi:hypothetical protein [Nocardioides caricicola]|uniref:Uncharacterized protein n=1 Tax=Nocardioides caricicola TaxID=634770 RepID=A0ABW0N2X1_9ACTN